MTPRTLVDIFRNLERTPKPDLLLVKKSGTWTPISTAQFMDTVKAVSSALKGLGVETGGRVALLSENRPEWAIVDFACQCYGAVLVPIFPTMMSEQVTYLLKDSGATVAFVSGEEQAKKVLAAREAAAEVKAALRHFVGFDPSSLAGVEPFTELLEKGKAAYAADPAAFEKRADMRTPDDLATFIYTSGTTGEPKGAMLTQRNFVSNVVAGCSILPFDSSAVALSFLPLAHVFERMLEYCFYHRAATIAYAESIDKLRDNMSEIHPHVFGAVPRVYEKIYARVQENLAKSFRGSASCSRRRSRSARRSSRSGTGRKRLISRSRSSTSCSSVSSTARCAASASRFRCGIGRRPSARELAEFFWAIGVEVYEGYGLTETSPVIAVNCPSAWRLGTVGKILLGSGVPHRADGEILTRGPHVMKGYFGKPKETAEAIDAEGWFHTGDIGMLDEDGFSRSRTGRRRSRQLERQEHRARADRELPQGLGLRLSARHHRRQAEVPLVSHHPELREAGGWAESNGLAGRPVEELVREPRVLALFQAAIDRWNDGRPTSSSCTASRPVEDSRSRGELTPTLKVKRRIIDQHYKDLIDDVRGRRRVDSNGCPDARRRRPRRKRPPAPRGAHDRGESACERATGRGGSRARRPRA